MKTVVIFLAAVLSLGAAAFDLPDLTETHWADLVNKPFEEVEVALQGYDLVIGDVGNVWTRTQWLESAKSIDFARSYIYHGTLSGQEIRVECWFRLDEAASRLHPVERLRDLVIEFDQPRHFQESCALSPWFESFFRSHPLYASKASAFGFGSCDAPLNTPFSILGPAWITENAVVSPVLESNGNVSKLGFFGFGLGGYPNRPSPEKCFKPWKGHTLQCLTAKTQTSGI